MQNVMNNFIDSFFESIHDSWVAFGRQLPNLILALIVIILGFMISAKLGDWAKAIIRKRTGDAITVSFLSKAIRILLSGLFIMYALRISGLESIATGILTAAGASAVIIGFAFRDIGENFISGIILSFNRPFNVGDTVCIGDIFGKIQSVQFRYSKLRTFDGKDVYIPNSDVIKKPVYNFTEDGFIRFDFIVGISYEDEVEQAQQIIGRILKTTELVFEDQEHQNFVCADELGTNTVNLKVHFWIKTYEYGKEALLIRGHVISLVKAGLAEAGINLPANIMEMKMYKNQPFLPMRIEEEAQKRTVN